MGVTKTRRLTCRFCGWTYADTGAGRCARPACRAAAPPTAPLHQGLPAPPPPNPRKPVARDHPATSNREYTDAELEFMTAMEVYKRRERRPYPEWPEVLAVVLSLGYRKPDGANG